MTSQEYIEKALRSESQNEYQKEAITHRLEHAVMGMVTESVELLDLIKKGKFHNKPVDTTKFIEETGDVMWYMAILADELGVTFEELWQKNIDKLKVRYPEKFTEEKAENRNLDAEHSVFGQ